jgi:hypothetical protein
LMLSAAAAANETDAATATRSDLATNFMYSSRWLNQLSAFVAALLFALSFAIPYRPASARQIHGIIQNYGNYPCRRFARTKGGDTADKVYLVS